MEFSDDRFVLPTSDQTSGIFCTLCPMSRKMLAVSVCSYEKDFLFRGCSQPFCSKHAYLVHSIKSFPGLPEELKEMLPSLKLPDDPKPDYIRCCLQCRERFEKAVLTPHSFAEAVKRNLLGAIFLVILAMLIFFVTSQETLSKMEDLAKKCPSHSKYSALLNKCIYDLSVDMVDSKVALKSLLYRGEASCFREQYLNTLICSCRFGMKLTSDHKRCRTYECDPQKEYLTKNAGCNKKKGLRLSSDTSHGCSDQTMWHEGFGICIQALCPRTSSVQSDGSCRQCMPYAYDSYRCYPISLAFHLESQYSTITGVGKSCSRNKTTGELIPFYDQLGQLQCPNSTMRVKYDRSLPPEQRPCLQSEIFLQEQLGCHFVCDDFEVYDFINHRCFRPICDLHYYNHKTKGCLPCHQSAKYECLRDDW